MPPTLSIIVPVYNVENHIEKCAVSLFEQTLTNIEYVFVNDCSPDNSMTVLKDVIRRYPERKDSIIIINHEYNKGLSVARFAGLQIATGDYIAHCDSDDWVESNMYEMMLNEAEKENADIVCSDIFIDRSLSIIEDKFDKNLYVVNKFDYLSKISLGGKYSALWNKLVKRSLYFENNTFPVDNISMWEDMVVTFRLIYFSQKTVIIHQSLYHYVYNEESISSTYSQNHILQQIKCSQFIENFFIDKGKSEFRKYFTPVQNLKFISKSQYLLNKNIRDFDLWRKTFPESNKYIWKYKGLSFYRRFVFWLASIGFVKTSSKMFDMKIFYNILKYIRK